MANPLLADISSWQIQAIDWQAYANWSKGGDGRSRVIMRASQGVGEPDSHFAVYYSQARAVVDEIIVYHYAYPNLHPGTNGAQAEARYFIEQVQNATGGLRPQDGYMLDLEQNESWEWARDFGLLLPTRSQKPLLYDSLSHIEQFYQQSILAELYALVVADWTYNPSSRPAAPWPWTSYKFLQYTDKVNVPGIGLVDGDVYTGPEPEFPIVVKVGDMKIEIEATEVVSVTVSGVVVYQASTANVPTVPPVPTPTPVQEPTPVSRTDTVLEHDTLSAIAVRNGVDEPTLCTINHDKLDEVARQHGLSSTDFEGDRCHYIWAGTVLVLP